MTKTASTLESRIRRLMQREIAQRRPIPPMKAVCDDVGLSERTIRRRLLSEGIRYQQIKDSVRQSLLAENAGELRSVAALASLLGYREAASFSRAFKKWTGLSPSEVPKQTHCGALLAQAR